VERNPGPFQKGFGRPSLGGSSTKQRSPEKLPDKTDIAPQVLAIANFFKTLDLVAGPASDKSYTVKKRLAIFPSLAGMSPTKFSLAGNNLGMPLTRLSRLGVIILFPARESLVGDIPPVDGELFYSVVQR
jgi:hypothetical protein